MFQALTFLTKSVAYMLGKIVKTFKHQVCHLDM